jgi:hypothetical protein
MKAYSPSPDIIGVVVAIVIAIGLFFYKHYYGNYSPSKIQTPTAISGSENPILSLTAPPIEIKAPPVELPTLGSPPKNINTALLELFGEKTLLSLLKINDFINHFVVTIDNLGGPVSSVEMWPVKKVDGQFQTEVSERYQPYVDAIKKIDPPKAAAIYFAFYPKIQGAYASIGYPDKQFNQRFIQVLDLLIKTPEASELMPVAMMKVEGPYQFIQPWTHYQFQKSIYEQLTIGQKIMLRLGPQNESAVKAKLKYFRELINRPIPARDG